MSTELFETLDDIVFFNPSRSLKKGTVAPFVEMAAIPEHSRDIETIALKEFKGSGSKFKNGDTLFARITPCLENGKTAKVSGLKDDEVAHGSTEFIVLAAKQPEYDEDFVYYLARLPSFRMYAESRMQGTSGRQRVSWQSLADFSEQLPSKEARKQIGHILKSLDNKITLNRQINQTLEAMAQALFKSWFVDFEPVKAKQSALAVGGSADDANLAAMSAISGKTTEQLLTLKTTHPDQFQQLYTTADLFPSEMVDSELGEIPKGWEVKAFGDLLKTTIGGDWGKDEPDDKHTEEVKILRGTDLPKVFLGDDTGVPIRYVEAKKLKTRIIETGDIVIEVSGGSKDQPTGRSLFVNQTLINRLNARLEPASFCRLFKPFSEKIGLFLGTYLQKIYQEGKTWHYQNQSTGISNFQTNTFLEKERLIVPCDNFLTVFYAHASPILDKIYSSESNELVTIRDTLLPKLLSGELLVDGVGDDVSA